MPGATTTLPPPPPPPTAAATQSWPLPRSQPWPALGPNCSSVQAEGISAFSLIPITVPLHRTPIFPDHISRRPIHLPAAIFRVTDDSSQSLQEYRPTSLLENLVNTKILGDWAWTLRELSRVTATLSLNQRSP